VNKDIEAELFYLYSSQLQRLIAEKEDFVRLPFLPPHSRLLWWARKFHHDDGYRHGDAFERRDESGFEWEKV